MCELGADLIPAWLTLPDVMDLLDVPMPRVRALLRDRDLVAVKRRNEDTGNVVLCVPGPMLVLADGSTGIIETLRGTVTVLTDLGMSDEEVIDWLMTVEPSLNATPLDALRSGRRAEVRRIAQALL